MSKPSLIALFALLIAFTPFLGIPHDMKNIMVVVGGAAIVTLAFLVRQERMWMTRALSGEHKTDAYTEHRAA